MDKREAAIRFQALLLDSGADAEDALDPGLYGYEPRNLFREIDR